MALENKIELITDDFAITNVARQLKIQTYSLMTEELVRLEDGSVIVQCVEKNFLKKKNVPYVEVN